VAAVAVAVAEATAIAIAIAIVSIAANGGLICTVYIIESENAERVAVVARIPAACMQAQF
jgi:hypothetical protein